MTFKCRHCDESCPSAGAIVLEEPGWGPSHFFCGWGCLETFAEVKAIEEASRRVNSPESSRSDRPTQPRRLP